MRQLIEDLISMMEYYVEQTRPIHTTTVALEAAREALKSLPQKQKPLTDEQMNALWFDTNKQHGSVIWRFARAIEAVHGIKE